MGLFSWGSKRKEVQSPKATAPSADKWDSGVVQKFGSPKPDFLILLGQGKDAKRVHVPRAIVDKKILETLANGKKLEVCWKHTAQGPTATKVRAIA